MPNSFDRIATVSIDIAASVSSSASFANILILGPLPKVAPSDAPAKVGAYSGIDDVAKAGWVTSGSGADPVGLAAAVAFAQSPKPSKIFIAPIQKVDSSAESAVTTLTRALDVDGWYVCCPVGVENDEVEACAALIESSEKMMGYTEMKFFGAGTSSSDKPSLGTTYTRTFSVMGLENADQNADAAPVNNHYAAVAFAARWLSFESGSETAAFKTVSLVSPFAADTTAESSMEKNCINYVSTVGGKNITMIGKVMAGEWCDVIRFRDWLKNDMQTRVANVFVSLPKVRFTDAGILLIKNAMIASLKAGQRTGGVAEAEYDSDGNEIPGYSVTVPVSADVNVADKSARKLTGCKFTARLSGAIHFAELSGTLAYSL